MHRVAVERPVRLAARPANCRSLAPVQHAELDSRRIGNTRHHAVKRINFAYQMALAQTANRGIAGHFANGRELVSDEKRRYTMTSRGCSRLAASMSRRQLR